MGVENGAVVLTIARSVLGDEGKVTTSSEPSASSLSVTFWDSGTSPTTSSISAFVSPVGISDGIESSILRGMWSVGECGSAAGTVRLSKEVALREMGLSTTRRAKASLASS